MRRSRIIALTAVTVLCILILGRAALPAFAQDGGPYELSWTIDAGGGALTGGAYSLVSTIGQPEAGPAAGGGAYSLTGGVIDAGGSGNTPPRDRKVYLPLVVRS